MSASTHIIRPRALRPGDTVGVISPSTATPDPEQLAQVRRAVEHLGLKIKIGAQVGKRIVSFDDWVRARVDDIHAMFSDPEVDGIFAVRGGAGAAHLLDHLDYELIRSHAKVLVGFSDITALHLVLHRHARIVSLHGPNGLARFPAFTLEHFRTAIFSSAPLGELRNPPEENPMSATHPTRVICVGETGIAAGPLVGGNLVLINMQMGTPHEIDTAGKIFFFEEVNETPSHIDRMLTQLGQAGKLRAAAGIVIGECRDCPPSGGPATGFSYYSLGEVWDHHLGDLGIPVLSGLTIGHTPEQLTLPVGVRARLDVHRAVLEVLEPALLPA